MKVTIPNACMEKLARADWSKYDRDGVASAHKESGGKSLDMIPEEYRFTGKAWVAIRYNLEA